MAKNKPEEIKPEEVKEKINEAVNEIVEAKAEDKKEENVKSLTVNTSFNDKYTGVNYEIGTKFVVADVEETEQVSKTEYKISKARAKELKASGYVV